MASSDGDSQHQLTDEHQLTNEQRWEFGSRPAAPESYRSAVYQVTPFDGDRLAEWVGGAMRRHDALRARLQHRGGEPFQRFTGPETAFEVSLVEGSGPTGELSGDQMAWPPAGAGEEIPALVVSVARDRLRTTAMVRLACHRAVIDDISFASLSRDAVRALDGDVPPPATEARSYEEFVRSAYRRDQSARVRANTSWWIDQIHQIDFDALRDIDGPPPTLGREVVRNAPLSLPPSATLQRVAGNLNVTVPSLLLGVSAGALGSLLGIRRLPVLVPATPGRLRHHAATIGNFVHPLYLGLPIGGEVSEEVQAISNALLLGLLRAPFSFPEWAAAFRSCTEDRGPAPLIISFVYEAAAGGDRQPADDSSSVRRVQDPRPEAVPSRYLEFRFLQESSTITGTIAFAGSSFRLGFIEDLREELLLRVDSLCR